MSASARHNCDRLPAGAQPVSCACLAACPLQTRRDHRQNSRAGIAALEKSFAVIESEPSFFFPPPMTFYAAIFEDGLHFGFEVYRVQSQWGQLCQLLGS